MGREVVVIALCAAAFGAACGGVDPPDLAFAGPPCAVPPEEPPWAGVSLGERVLVATSGAGTWFSACDQDGRELVRRAEQADLVPGSGRHTRYLEILEKLSAMRIHALSLQSRAKGEELGERELERQRSDLLSECRALLEGPIEALQPTPDRDVF